MTIRTLVAGTLVAAVFALTACVAPAPAESPTGPSLPPDAQATDRPETPAAVSPSDPGPSASVEPAPLPTYVVGPLKYDRYRGTSSVTAFSVRKDGTSGSGCAPSSPTELPDGVWFGKASKWREYQVTFDLACHWGDRWGLEDQSACQEDGTDILERHCVTNNNTAKRKVAVHPYALVQIGGDNYAWVFNHRKYIAKGGWDAPSWDLIQGWVWIYVNDGEVTAIEYPYMGA